MTLHDALPALEAARDRFVDDVDALTEAQRAWRPSPDAWSPSDIAEHLMRSEQSLLWALDRQLAAGEARREVGEPSEAAMQALLAGLGGEVRYTMPESAARYIAPTGAAWVETRRAWAEAARGWRGAASALPDDLQDAGLIRHPRVGPITAAGAARFSAAHTVHHHAQLDRVRDAHGFPA